MEEIKRTFSLKFRPYPEQEEEIKSLFAGFRDCVLATFKHIQLINSLYIDIPKEEMTTCHDCQEKGVVKQHKINQTKHCNQCFSIKWSHFTLVNTKAEDSWITQLKQIVPQEGFSIQSTYYAGAIKYAVESFKSYLTKIKDRQKEIKRLEKDAQACIYPEKQAAILKKIEQKKKPLKDWEFKGNVVSFGGTSMFDFRSQSTGQYELGISNPLIKRERIWMPLELGNREDYHTEHNKYELVDNMIKTKEHKALYAKLLKRTIMRNAKPYSYYEIMLPKRDGSSSLTIPEEIIKEYNKNNKLKIACISFGIVKPATITYFNTSGKLLKVANIGSGELWNYTQHSRKIRAKIGRKLARKYLDSKWLKHKASKAYYSKRQHDERNRIKTMVHTFTKQVIKNIKYNCPDGCIIIIQDTKGIKQFSYPGIYQKVLSAWNTQLQKTHIEYKAMLKNFHILQLPYNKTNNLICSRCGTEIKDDKNKVIKTLTVKLNHAMNKRGEIKEKIKVNAEKKEKLLKYPQTDKIILWFRKLGEAGTKLSEQLMLENKKDYLHKIKCSKCSYNEDFYRNEAFTFMLIFREEIKAQAEQASACAGQLPRP